jgi:hypothetical protein
MFRSIEPVDRRREPMFGTIENKERSPSVNTYHDAYMKMSIENASHNPTFN